MKKIKIDLKNIKNKQIQDVVGVLKKGKIIIYPTDTIYGLGCDATNERAIKKIFQIKKRSEQKALLILVPDLKILKKYCQINSRQADYLKALWPLQRLNKSDRPTTVILKKKPLLPPILTGGKDSIAVRVPDNIFLQAIFANFKKPLVSTSVNLSGEKHLLDLEKIIKIFKDQVDAVIDCGKIKKTLPSRILDIRDINNIKIIRK